MNYNLSRKQIEVWKAVQSLKHRYILIGGGMGGGKTRIAAFLLIGLAIDLPKTRYGVFRKNMTVLKRTTYLTFKAVAAELNIQYHENRAEMVWTFQKGSTISFIEMDETKDTDFNKLKGLELTAAFIDEANEVLETGFNILKLRIGRCNTNGEPAFILLSCNPAQNWVKYIFFDKYSDGSLPGNYAYIQMLAADNPFLPQAYMESFDDLPEVEYNRYVLGDWNYADDPQQLIKYEWLKNNICLPNESAQYMAIDVARYGDDMTSIGYRNENRFVKYELMQHIDTHAIAEIVIERAKDKAIGYNRITCDVIGVGGGVIDTCRARGYYINEFNSASKAEDVEHRVDGEVLTTALLYKNMRAFAYWNLRMGLQDGNIKVIEDKELYKQLMNTRYIIKDKTIGIESKDEIKKRIGKSPDIADTVAMIFTLKDYDAEITYGQAKVFNNYNMQNAKKHTSKYSDRVKRLQGF